jgi:hypothetical protein
MSTNWGRRKKEFNVGYYLMLISRMINRVWHGKSYMLCSTIWIITNGGKRAGRVRDSILISYVVLVLYVPFRHILDFFFFMIKGDANHCEECYSEEIKLIPHADTEGMCCKVPEDKKRFNYIRQATANFRLRLNNYKGM